MTTEYFVDLDQRVIFHTALSTWVRYMGDFQVKEIEIGPHTHYFELPRCALSPYSSLGSSAKEVMDGLEEMYGPASYRAIWSSEVVGQMTFEYLRCNPEFFGIAWLL